ncbi:hypothetical protein ES703_11031 [subsurface metagenome]
MKDYSKNEVEWKEFQEKVKRVNKERDILGVFIAIVKINVKLLFG